VSNNDLNLVLLKVTFFFHGCGTFFLFLFFCFLMMAWRIGWPFLPSGAKGKKGGQIIKFIIGSRNSQKNPKKKKNSSRCAAERL
jgi:hypothetical protein